MQNVPSPAVLRANPEALAELCTRLAASTAEALMAGSHLCGFACESPPRLQRADVDIVSRPKRMCLAPGD